MVGRLLECVRGALAREVELYPVYRVVFCGHSMGGAVAAMAAMRYRQEVGCDRCISLGLGTPAIVSRSLGERSEREESVFTVINGRDWAPRVSVSNMYELLHDV